MEETGKPEQILRNILHEKMQVYLFLWLVIELPLLFREIRMQELNDIWVVQVSDDLQLPIFVMLILQNLLDCYFLVSCLQGGITHSAECSSADETMRYEIPIFIFSLAELVVMLA